jgi:hypothetical protein
MPVVVVFGIGVLIGLNQISGVARRERERARARARLFF